MKIVGRCDCSKILALFVVAVLVVAGLSVVSPSWSGGDGDGPSADRAHGRSLRDDVDVRLRTGGHLGQRRCNLTTELGALVVLEAGETRLHGEGRTEWFVTEPVVTLVRERDAGGCNARQAPYDVPLMPESALTAGSSAPPRDLIQRS